MKQAYVTQKINVSGQIALQKATFDENGKVKELQPIKVFAGEQELKDWIEATSKRYKANIAAAEKDLAEIEAITAPE